MASSQKGSLVPWALRSHRRGALLIGLGFGGSVMALAPAYVVAAKAISGGMTALAQQATPIAKSFEFLTGPVDRLDTVGGYLSYKIYPDIALLVAIYAAIQGAAVIRGSETKGLMDLWLCSGRTRSHVMRERSLAFLAALTAAVVCIYALTVVGGAMSDAALAGSALGQCVVIECLGGFSFALALLWSQFVTTARTASGSVAAFIVVGFFIANMANSLGDFTFARYLSPFYYYVENRTLAGVGFDWSGAAILVGAATAAFISAVRFDRRRDSGGTVGPARHSKPTDYRFQPSALWHRTLTLHWIAEQRVSLLCWTGGLAIFTAIEAAVVPSAMTLINDNSGALKKVLADHGPTLTTDQYLSFFLSFSALLVAGFGVTQIARWASDSSQHRTDLLLVQPLSIGRLLTERAATVVLMAFVVGVATAVGVWIGTLIGNYSVNVVGLARSVLAIVLLGAAVGGLGMSAVAVWRSSVATAVMGAILAAMFLLTTVAGLLSWPAWTARLSVITAFGTPYASWQDAWSIAYLLGLAIGGGVLAYAVMRLGPRIAA